MKRQTLVLLAAGSLLVSRAAAQASQAPKDYTAADVNFMSGMIYHHAQAILIAGWAKSHGASPAVQTLCDRIIVSQTDEINLLSRWLAPRQPTAPPGAPPPGRRRSRKRSPPPPRNTCTGPGCPARVAWAAWTPRT